MDGGGGSKVECYIKGAGVFGTRKTMFFLFFGGLLSGNDGKNQVKGIYICIIYV